MSQGDAEVAQYSSAPSSARLGIRRCRSPSLLSGPIEWAREADFFFFQAEDGIRDLTVTGVQTCALPICVLQLPQQLLGNRLRLGVIVDIGVEAVHDVEARIGKQLLQRRALHAFLDLREIGRASCRERV